ncbi:hypothetical protein M8494_12970 [Serratia ureilytica]
MQPQLRRRFPLFNKIDVNGPSAHPLFNELKRLAPGILGSRRTMEFHQFLLTADVARHALCADHQARNVPV